MRLQDICCGKGRTANRIAIMITCEACKVREGLDDEQKKKVKRNGMPICVGENTIGVQKCFEKRIIGCVETKPTDFRIRVKGEECKVKMVCVASRRSDEGRLCPRDNFPQPHPGKQGAKRRLSMSICTRDGS